MLWISNAKKTEKPKQSLAAFPYPMHPNEVVHFAGDVFGYFIHGLGAIPFFKKVENNVE